MAPESKANPPQDEVASYFMQLRNFAREFYNNEFADSPDPFLRVVIRRATEPLEEFELDGEFYNRFKELSLSSDRGYDEYFDLGVDIGGSIIEASKNDRDKILYLMNAYTSMNFILSALAVHSKDEPEMIHSRVTQLVAATIIDSVEDHEKFHDIIFKVMSTIEELEDNAEFDVTEKLAKAYWNALVILSGLNTNKRIEKGRGWEELVGRYKISHIDSLPDKEVTRLCDLLTQEAMSHRKYGTKPAYIDASIGGSWVFYDGERFKEHIDMPSDMASNIAAVVLHVPEGNLRDLRMQSDHYPHTEGALAHVNVGSQKHDFMVFIRHDGKLTTDQLGINTLEMTFAGNIDGALRLKAEVVSNFYDLSMPIYKKAPEPKNYPNMTASEKVDFDPIQQLLVPRIRYVDQPPREVSDITRTVREHDVTWFVRLLPAGFRASPDAVIEASKHGIVLEENETFIKEHKRGSHSEKVLGYHAVKRAKSS